MASIVGSAKYGEGHKVVLKDADKIPASSGSAFKEHKYEPGSSTFTITKTAKANSVDTVIQLGAGNSSIMFIDEKKKVVLVKGTESAINNTFNHYSDNSKSNTGQLTEIKELVSMYMFEAAVENSKTLTEDQVIAKLGDKKKLYNTVYYRSAVAQTKELVKFMKGAKGYHYERQAQDKTAAIYVLGRKLSGKSNDNWNPADVWMIKKTYKLDGILKAKTIDEYNSLIAAAFKKKDLIPISLKQVEGDKATMSIVDPSSQMNQKLDYDMSFLKVDLSDTYANFIIQTKSGFAVRCGFKASATTLNVSLEGRFVGAGFQLGAVDAKQFGPFIKDKYNYTVRSGNSVTTASHATAKAELKQLFTKYPRLSNTIKDYKQAEALFNKADKLTKDRFANLISYLYSFLGAANTPAKFKDTMTFCYFSSKKLTSGSCVYAIIQP